MKPFRLSPEADEDVWNIWQYLVREAGIAVADRIEAELFDAFERLARSPGIGHARSDLTDHPAFFFAVYQYLIVYRKGVPLEIAAIIHGRRDCGAGSEGASVMPPASPAYFEIIDFIAAGTTPEQVARFHPSPEAQQRVAGLIQREKENLLSPEEKAELDHFMALEHILRMAKAKARQILSRQRKQ